MRILALITDVLAGQGGIQRYNLHFLSALSSMSGENCIVVLPRIANTNGNSMPPRVVWKRSRTDKLGYALDAIKALWKDGPFDFIFCGHLHLAPLAAILAQLAQIPLWLQLYGIEAWERSAAPFHWSVKQATLITTISRYTRQRFLSWSGVLPEKVRVLHCTFDGRFQPGPKPNYLLRRYGLTGKKVLLTLSRLSSGEQYKGQDRIICLMLRLLQAHPDLVYVIAGQGDDHERLRAIVREQSLNEAVRFIGHVEESELVDHYRMADLFVMPSTSEGFGIVFIEAAACGIPVVGGGEDGSFDALLEGKLGRLVKPDNLEELRQAILEGLASREAYPERVKGFSLPNVVHSVETLIREGVGIAAHTPSRSPELLETK